MKNIAYRYSMIDIYIEMHDDTRLMNIRIERFEASPTVAVLESRDTKIHYKNDPCRANKLLGTRADQPKTVLEIFADMLHW